MYKFENHKILLLDLWGSGVFDKYSNVTCGLIYRKCDGIDKKIYKLAEHFPKLFNMERFYADWKYDVSQYDTIIISDGIRGRDVIEYIRKLNPTARIIFYFANPLDMGDRKSPANYQDFGIEFYTFDPDDAEEWNINFKYCFYSGYDYLKKRWSDSRDIKQDLFFVGEDKGRLDCLIQIKEQLAEYDMNLKLHVLPSKHVKYIDGEKKYLQTNYLSQEEALEEGLHSRAILEFQQDGQSGVTLRTIVAMILGKKIISNNEGLKKLDFYNEDNVLILKDDTDGTTIKKFLESPYRKYPEEMVLRYKPEIWLESFF